VEFHIHLATPECHPFCLEPEALFKSLISAKLDGAASAEHPLPRQPDRAVKSAYHLPSGAGESCAFRNRTVGRHFAARNAPDRRYNFVAHFVVQSLCPRSYNAIHPTRISHNDPAEISSHRITPCNSGRCPTLFNVAREIPVPIRYNVAVSPIFAILHRRS
jgi:hypothetical protein